MHAARRLQPSPFCNTEVLACIDKKKTIISYIVYKALPEDSFEEHKRNGRFRKYAAGITSYHHIISV